MPLLEISNLKKAYRSPDGGHSPILDIKEFCVQEAEQIALAGSSGCGKTTFLNLLAGIQLPDSGSIRMEGLELVAMPEAERDRHRAQNIGYIFQTFNLLQGYSALENVLLAMMFVSTPIKAYAEHLLERVGLADRITHRPSQLSVGQQQRVAVARALANRPKLVLADEPTGNLDSKNAADALTLIRQICTETKAALLLVSHDQSILNQFSITRPLNEINRIASNHAD